MQAGMVGVLEAWENYNPAKGANINTHLYTRVRGSIMDAIRQGHHDHRRGKGKDAYCVVSLGGVPDFNETAAEDLPAYERLKNEKRSLAMWAAIDSLPKRWQIIVRLYCNNLTLREIGEVMDFGEARACQLLGKVVKVLRDKLNAWI